MDASFSHRLGSDSRSFFVPSSTTGLGYIGRDRRHAERRSRMLARALAAEPVEAERVPPAPPTVRKSQYEGWASPILSRAAAETIGSAAEQTADRREVCAWHEAGHAVMALALGDRVQIVSIAAGAVPNGDGYTRMQVRHSRGSNRVAGRCEILK